MSFRATDSPEIVCKEEGEGDSVRYNDQVTLS